MQLYQSKTLWVFICFFIFINGLVAGVHTSSINFNSVNEGSKKNLIISIDSIQKYRDLAIDFSNKSQAKESVEYIIKYISATSDMSFINDHLFTTIEDTIEYQEFKQKYSPKIGVLGFFYFFVGAIGIFIFVILNLKKSADPIGNFLISLFVLFHSVFMLHKVLYVMNGQFYFPHALLISSTFSFLYGPLLYFYCKRIIYNYQFRLVDLLHLLPTIVLFIYIFPYYLMSRLEKFNEVFNIENGLLPGAHPRIVVKIMSLTIYAYLLIRIYKNSNIKVKKDKSKYLWQRNIIALHSLYAVAYIFYALALVKIINFPLLFHFQTIVMVSVVFYVAYIAYEQPEIFKGNIKLIDPYSLFKYKKSGLTPSYSIELTDNLLKLLNEDKIYKENNLNLELLSEKLDTTRHNTSQIINEHFNMNFSELMNKYRILEAVEILKGGESNSLKIIQIAYEVGFNNKVTFNKSFKKHLSQTPSEFIKSIHT